MPPSFSSARVLSGQLWRWVTYGLLNFPSPWFALDMLMIVWFGRELERLFGRRLFLWLYAGIYLIAPIVPTAVGLVHPTLLSGQPGALALFIAFATQFPGMPVFFSLLAKWAALILVGIYALMALAAGVGRTRSCSPPPAALRTDSYGISREAGPCPSSACRAAGQNSGRYPMECQTSPPQQCRKWIRSSTRLPVLGLEA